MYAPRSHKTRICVFCGKIVKIPEDARSLPSPEAARQLIIKLNSSESFLNEPNVEKMTTKTVEKSVGSLPSSKSKLLMSLLQRGRQSLTILLRDAVNEGLDEEWVKKQLEILSQQGVVYFPKPWEVSPISYPGENIERKILDFLSQPATLEEISQKIGLSEEETKKLLESLENRGIIIHDRDTWRR